MHTGRTLRSLLSATLDRNPGGIALIQGERHYSFQDFAARTYCMGNALLGLGLRRGDRVAVLSRNSIESAECYFSVPNAGLVLVMLNFRLAPSEIMTILKDARPPVVMVSGEFADQIQSVRESAAFVKHWVFIGDQAGTPSGWLHYEALIDQSRPHEPDVTVAEEDLAALMYTSGTTGAPKGCMVVHRNFYHVGRSMALEMDMDLRDVGIIPSPLFHASGEVVLMGDVFNGTPSVIMPRWDAEEFMRLVERHKVTTGVLATPMLLFFVAHPKVDRYDLSSLRRILFAGAPVTPVVFQRAIERFGNVFAHGFGTTETVGSVSILKPQVVARALEAGKTNILASCGRSYAGMEAEVVDGDDRPVLPGEVGEIRVRGQGVTLGYWSKEAETRKSFRNGWFYTEDLARLDDQGFLYVAGRKKDMIITGGENVFPAEVENVLYRHPAVGQAAVIGTYDETWGEAVTAVVVPKDEARVTEDDIRSFCRHEIAGYKVPKKVFFVDSLPLSASGKLLKSKLKEQFTS